MTENEKLRALLAEARGVIDEGYDRGIPSIIQRIDAALAEPVVRCGECHGDLTESRPGRHQCDACDAQRVIVELTKERDEARAEVERLSTWGPLKRLHTEMEAEVKAAYRRGAEAMREAAARTYWQMAPAIRALPVPEDK